MGQVVVVVGGGRPVQNMCRRPTVAATLPQQLKYLFPRPFKFHASASDLKLEQEGPTDTPKKYKI